MQPRWLWFLNLFVILLSIAFWILHFTLYFFLVEISHMGAIIEIESACGFISHLLFFQTEVIYIYFLVLELFQWKNACISRKYWVPRNTKIRSFFAAIKDVIPF